MADILFRPQCVKSPGRENKWCDLLSRHDDSISNKGQLFGEMEWYFQMAPLNFPVTSFTARFIHLSIDGLVQDCSISIADALETLRFCA